jgi:hypothetical protein
MLAASISFAKSACRTVGLALIAMISGSTPIFCKSFLSSITQIGLLVGLKPAHASLSFSCALPGTAVARDISSPADIKMSLVTIIRALLENAA